MRRPQSVDPENEQELLKAVRELTRDRTILMIAHRLSTVRDADNILVVEKGSIREQGTHDQLEAQDGLYAKMWQDYRQQPPGRLERRQ